MKIRRLGIIFIILFCSFSLTFLTQCGRSSDEFSFGTGPDDDFDKDGIPNKDDEDDDNDGCPDKRDPDPFNANKGCDTDDDDDDDDDDYFDPKCLEEGEFIPIGHDSDFDLSDCIRTITDTEMVKIDVEVCLDHKEYMVIVGDQLRIESYATHIGDVSGGGHVGGWPGEHINCDEGFRHRALVKVTPEGEKTRNIIWHYPAFIPLKLNIEGIDATKPSFITGVRQQQEHSADVNYTSMKNGFDTRFHLFTFYDRVGNSHFYHIDFDYRYTMTVEGYYE